jgi:CRISPR-associated protein Csb1
LDYVGEGLVAEPEDLKDATGKVKDKHPFAQRGYTHHPASGSLGGIIAEDIRHDASLHLAALRLLTAGEDEQKTLALQRYVLGLALTAFTCSPTGYLRQGCNLVLDPDRRREFSEVYGDGRRVTATVNHDEALEYAKAVALAFDVGSDRQVQFDKEKAKTDISEDGRVIVERHALALLPFNSISRYGFPRTPRWKPAGVAPLASACLSGVGSGVCKKKGI